MYTFENFFKGSCCQHSKHTVIALCRLGRNQKLLEIFAYPSNNRAFYRPELNL